MTPDWQLPPGVDRGLHDYIRSTDMVAGYDAQMAMSPLAAADVRFCEETFPTPGRLIDLGCGTGRLAVHFAKRGYAVVGVDLSDAMLGQAKRNAAGVSVAWANANLVDLAGLADASFDYAACLFSTLGMIRGADHRLSALRSANRVLKSGGRLVLHVHNRWFTRRAWPTGDATMSQAYGGAPLTLHHFTRGEATRLLATAGFRITRIVALGVDGPLKGSLFSTIRAYGYLIATEKKT